MKKATAFYAINQKLRKAKAEAKAESCPTSNNTPIDKSTLPKVSRQFQSHNRRHFMTPRKGFPFAVLLCAAWLAISVVNAQQNVHDTGSELIGDALDNPSGEWPMWGGSPHDWPEVGLCSTACVVGDRSGVSTNRCQLSCLDAEGRVIDWQAPLGAMREVRGDKLVLTTVEAGQNRIAERMPEWMKPLYHNGLSATLDDNNNVVSVMISSIATDELLAKLATLPQLQELHIEVTKKLSSQGLAQLGKMPKLEKLSLYQVNTEGPWLGDDAIRSVVGLTSLRELSIAECGTTDAGAKLLEQLTQLTTLSLRQEGRLTDEALKSIGKLSRLQSLSLASYVGIERLGWMRFSADGIRQLSGLKELTTLHLVGHDVPADALDFPKLTSLSLGHANVGDEVGAQIGRLQSLRNLELSYSRIGDRSIKLIASLPDLRQFNISGSTVTDAGIGHLRSHKSLEHITLRVDGLTDQSLDHVAQIETLTRLDLYGSGQPGVAPGRNFSGAGLRHLKRLPKLETLWLTNFELAAGCAALKEMPHLRELTMMMCDITESELEALDEALPNTRISHTTGGGSWLSNKTRKDLKTSQEKTTSAIPRVGDEG